MYGLGISPVPHLPTVHSLLYSMSCHQPFICHVTLMSQCRNLASVALEGKAERRDEEEEVDRPGGEEELLPLKLLSLWLMTSSQVPVLHVLSLVSNCFFFLCNNAKCVRLLIHLSSVSVVSYMLSFLRCGFSRVITTGSVAGEQEMKKWMYILHYTCCRNVSQYDCTIPQWSVQSGLNSAVPWARQFVLGASKTYN